MPEKKSSASDPNRLFPDFCRLSNVFTLTIVAELVAIIATVGRDPKVDFWGLLSLLSLYCQWIAIMSAGVLCQMRKIFARVQPAIAYSGALAIILLIATLASVFADVVNQSIRLRSDISFVDLWRKSLVIGALVGAAALRYFHIQARWRQIVIAEAETRFRALQARIRPHFLFNSMNTIAGLIRGKPETAEDAVIDLSELFRAALAPLDSPATLAHELDLCRKYVDIERLRLGDRLQVDWDTDALPGQEKIPPLLLQPLFENAIYHGIQGRETGGTLVVRGWTEEDYWILQLDNPMPRHKQTSKGHGIALDNIEKRLTHRYGDAAKLNIQQQSDIFSARIEAPLEGERV